MQILDNSEGTLTILVCPGILLFKSMMDNVTQFRCPGMSLELVVPKFKEVFLKLAVS